MDSPTLQPREPIARRAPATLGMAALALAAAAHLSALWPGIMTWDAIRQYRQALGGRYDDWHPPAMNWLWRQLLPIAGGPAPMMALQVLLYWSGFALLCAWAWRHGRIGLAVALGACALLPIPLLLMATVLKDSLMAGALLCATGLLLRRPFGAWFAVPIAALLLLGAATLRFNAAVACLPLVLLMLPAGWHRSWWRCAGTMLAAGAALLLALPAANALLHARRSGVELSLIIYDLAGITRYSGVDAFPPLGIAEPVAVNARCYATVSWDRYAWWGEDPCPIGFAAVRMALRRDDTSGYALWAHAVAAHPIAYAAHRLAHFNSNVRFLVRDADEPPLSLRSDPNPWGFAVHPGAFGGALERVAVAAAATPLGWPACWLALGLGTLLLSIGLAETDFTLPILASAILYGFSYLPLSVASELRYHLWTMVGVAVATAMVVDRLVERRRAPTRLLGIAAAAPVLMVTALALAARA